LYQDEHIGLANIGIIFGVSRTVIQKTLSNEGVSLDTTGQKFKGGKPAANQRYTEKHKKEIAVYNTTWQKENRAKLRSYHTEWRKKNKKAKSDN